MKGYSFAGIIFFSFFFLLPSSTKGSQLEVILKTDKRTYLPQEPLLLKLSITNKSKKIFHSTFFSSQKYDFIVRKDKKEVWRWSQDRVFAMSVTEFILSPGQSVTFQEEWVPEESNAGKRLLPGKYEIIGLLKTKPEITSLGVVIELNTVIAPSD